MADTTISGLTNLAATGNAVLPISFQGTTYQTPASSIVDTIASRKNFVILPSGTTAERGTATTGAIRYNTTTNAFETYNGQSWYSFGGRFQATGGVITQSTINGTSYQIHTFTGSSNFTVVAGSRTVEVLVVAGGGGGGHWYASGGGAGGAIWANATIVEGAYQVTVGAGGAGQTGAPDSSDAPGSFGQDGFSSSFANTIVAIGGGGGCGYNASGNITKSGGSCGGGRYPTSPRGTILQGTTNGGLFYGNLGGIGADSNNMGGGGGAGGQGGDAVAGTRGGNGGVAINLNFRVQGGELFGGGGGGSSQSFSANQGLGGSGIGGNASYNGNAGDGLVNTGSGGGGNANNTGSGGYGGNGGSGIVIVRYSI